MLVHPSGRWFGWSEQVAHSVRQVRLAQRPAMSVLADSGRGAGRLFVMAAGYPAPSGGVWTAT